MHSDNALHTTFINVKMKSRKCFDFMPQNKGIFTLISAERISALVKVIH